MNKLNFLTAGIPIKAKPRDYETAFDILKEMNLDGIELEFVRGVRMSEASQISVKNAKQYLFTAHAPFYINLNAKEEDKIEASIQRIIETARLTNNIGGYSITYHAAYYMNNEKQAVFQKVVEKTQKIIEQLEKENIKIWIRPETTGKATQWGDLDEIISLSKEFSQVLPCIDFSHVHARTNGKFNTYDEFCSIFEKLGNELGNNALENFHGHLAGIEYSSKGEKKHLELDNSDMNYKDLLKAFKKFDVKGALVCESPNIEDDCKIIKTYYESI